MKEIENIPSDEVVEMTALLHRLFNAGGCNPMCHCCKIMLPIGAHFKLATIEKVDWKYGTGTARESMRMIPTGTSHTKEVMLCDQCTAESYKHYQEKMFAENQAEYLRREQLHKEQGGGCFRINGKIAL